MIALLAILSGPLRSETLYLDTFDNSNDDGSDVQLNGRTDFSGVSGLAASPENYLESFGAQQELSGDELKLVKRSTQTAPGAGARFGAQTERFNWAAGTTGTTILSEGGMKISLDFSLADVADNNDWITLAFGTVNNDGDSVSVYNASGVDYGLRFEGEGLSTALRKAKKNGIKVVTWDADAEPDSRDFLVNQATPEGIGFTLMDEAAKAMGGKGDFAIITSSLTAANQNEWLKYITPYVFTKENIDKFDF